MFIIYIDRLRKGEETDIDETHPPLFLELDDEREIQASSEVSVRGTAYFAEQWLIIQGSISTTVTLRCAICNENFIYPIHIDNWMYEESLSNISSAVFSYAEHIRTAVLLEVPFFAQCGGSYCLRFSEVKQYFREYVDVQERDGIESKEKREDTHRPFKDLIWNSDNIDSTSS